MISWSVNGTHQLSNHFKLYGRCVSCTIHTWFLIFNDLCRTEREFVKLDAKIVIWGVGEFLLYMEWRHAAEEHHGVIRIDVFIDPFGPCSKDPIIGNGPLDFFVLDLSTFERSTRPNTRKRRLKSVIWTKSANNWLFIHPLVFTYRTFILGVFIHQMYVLKMRKSTSFQFFPCLEMDLGLIIRSNMLCTVGSSEFDSTKNGAQ